MSHEQLSKCVIATYRDCQVGVNPDVAVGVARARGLTHGPPRSERPGLLRRSAAGASRSASATFSLNVRNGLGTQALKAGIDPRDPNQWQAADQYAIDQMKAGGLGPWKGDKFAASYEAGPRHFAGDDAPGVVDPSIVARGGTSPPLDAAIRQPRLPRRRPRRRTRGTRCSGC